MKSMKSRVTRAPAAERCRDCVTRPACIGADLGPEALAILPGLLSPSGTINAGSHLYRPGDSAEQQYHVRSGCFKTYVLNADGEERVTGFFLPGEILGNAQRDARHIDGAIALETSNACRLQISRVGELEQINRLTVLMQKLAQREAQFSEHQLNLLGTAAQARFAGFCLQYSAKLKLLGRRADLLPLPMSRTDIASYLGMTLESLSRVTTKLGKVGLIRSNRTELELHDIETLKTLAVDGTYQPQKST